MLMKFNPKNATAFFGLTHNFSSVCICIINSTILWSCPCIQVNRKIAIENLAILQTGDLPAILRYLTIFVPHRILPLSPSMRGIKGEGSSQKWPLPRLAGHRKARISPKGCACIVIAYIPYRESSCIKSRKIPLTSFPKNQSLFLGVNLDIFLH